MIFEPGKDSKGHIPLLEDKAPVFRVCGPYTICRVVMNRGIVCDAWVRVDGEVINLEAAVSLDRAVKACRRHHSGHRS